MSNQSFEVPILIILFSRLEFSKQILKKTKEIGARKLYIACDKWRDHVLGEKEKVLASRKYFKDNIDWDCEVKYFFSNKNQGSGEGVFNAISWLFKNEKYGIILEEDVIPSHAFFYFCEEMLNKYENDLRIWNISGQNHFLGKKNLNPNDSYFFSKYPSIWGWATWANRWKHTSFYMDKMEVFIRQNYKYSHTSRQEGKFALIRHVTYHNVISKSKPKTWDRQWDFTLNTNRSIGIIPSKNLTTNIGINGVHSSGPVKYAHLLPVEENFEIEKHPDFIQTNWLYDDEYFKIFRKKKSLFERTINKIKVILKRILY